MSSNSIFTVIAKGKSNFIKDIKCIKGFWNENRIWLGGSLIVLVDKNIFENGGGGNCRCLVTVKDGNIVAKSMSWLIDVESEWLMNGDEKYTFKWKIKDSFGQDNEPYSEKEMQFAIEKTVNGRQYVDISNSKDPNTKKIICKN